MKSKMKGKPSNAPRNLFVQAAFDGSINTSTSTHKDKTKYNKKIKHKKMFTHD